MEPSNEHDDQRNEKGLFRRIGGAMRDPLAGRDLREVVDRNGDGVLYRGTPFERRAVRRAEAAAERTTRGGHRRSGTHHAPKPSHTFDGFGTKPKKVPSHAPWVHLDQPMLDPSRPTNTSHSRLLRERDGHGDYVWRRRRLHRRIVDHIMRPTTAEPKPAGERKVYFLGGGPGAGKSSLEKSGVVKFPSRTDALHLSPDEVKELIPEYQAWTDEGVDAASYVHEESRHVYDIAVHKGITSGHDMVLDTTGNGSWHKHKQRLREMKRNGHRVVAHYVTSDIQTALDRAHERREKTGRGVPDSQLIHAHGEVSRIVPRSLKAGLFDEFYLWDNSVDGEAPKLVAHLDDTGHLVVDDLAAWMRFIRKGERPKPKQPKGKRKPPVVTTRSFSGFGSGKSQAQREFEELLDLYGGGEGERRSGHRYQPKPKPAGMPGAGMESYVGKKADPTGAPDPLDEALALLGEADGADVDDYADLYIEVIQHPERKPRNPLEQYIRDEYEALGGSGCDLPFDTPRVVPGRVARRYERDAMADERGQKDVFSGMVTGGDARPDRLGRVQRDGTVVGRSTASRRRRLLRERTEFAKPTGTMNNILTKRSTDPRVIDAKTFALAALWNHTPVLVEYKSGLIGSKDPVVQAVESVVSYGVPGDMSRLRSPVRSTVYRAATPGGGGGKLRGGSIGRTIGRGVSDALRCPTGYQYGGRFSNRFLNNCGQQLFDLPGNIDEPNAPRAVLAVRRTIADIRGLGTQAARAGRIGAGDYTNLSATISRMVDVPHVGGLNKRKTEEQVASAVAAAAAAKGDFLRLVRRDGVALDSKVPAKRLLSQTKNVDMQDGTVVARVATLAKMGRDEVGLLGGGIRSVRLVVPGGHEFRLDRTRDLTPAEGTALRREWGAITRRLKEDDGPLGLQQLAQAFNGLSYSETFNDLQNPHELVRIERNGVERVVPRWAYRSFYADNAPGRTETGQAWKEIGVVSQANDQAVAKNVASLGEAVKLLENNGSLADVPGRFVGDLTNNRKLFSPTDLGNGRTLLERRNGERYVRSERAARDALTVQIAADVSRALGVPTPTTRLTGTGATRTLIAQTADTAMPEAKLVFDGSVGKAARADLARIALTDYLFGVDGRSPGSIALLGAGGSRPVPVPVEFGTPNQSAALLRKPEEVLTSANHWTAPHFATPQRQVQQSIVKMYDNLLKDATSFDWDAYVARLGLDGQLSPADKQHLAIVRRLYAARLDRLRSGRKTVLRVFGAST